MISKLVGKFFILSFLVFCISVGLFSCNSRVRKVSVFEDPLSGAISFSSASPITLTAQIHGWDGVIEWSTTNQPDSWETWESDVPSITNDVTSTSGHDNEGAKRYYIYLRGSGNSVITGANGYSDPKIWKVETTDSDIILNGDMQNLFEYNPSEELKDMGTRSLAFFLCNNTKLQSISDDFKLPMTRLSDYCYQSMFEGCSSLVSLPDGFNLPATTLTDYCYSSMFDSFSSLASLPDDFKLPATILAHHCYQGVFYGCSSLSSLPDGFEELRATSLTYGCYTSMFNGCSKLKFSLNNTGEYANALSFKLGDWW